MNFIVHLSKKKIIADILRKKENSKEAHEIEIIQNWKNSLQM